MMINIQIEYFVKLRWTLVAVRISNILYSFDSPCLTLSESIKKFLGRFTLKKKIGGVLEKIRRKKG